MEKQLTEKLSSNIMYMHSQVEKLPSTINLTKSKGMTVHDSQKGDSQMRG